MAQKEKQLQKLEKETQNPDFWNDKKRAAAVNQEIAHLKETKDTLTALEETIQELKELESLQEGDARLMQEIEEKYVCVEKDIAREELRIFLGGKYDSNNAILQIVAGAGGIDSQDWTTMLLRMFERYCTAKGFRTSIIHQSFGEGGGPDGRIGTKSVTVEIKGPYAYGLLKKEAGVHRMVRLSPFSAKKLRHTSFALVEVLPEIGSGEVEEIIIRPEDIRVDTFRASGPGGQYVNKRESAVRITHLATGITTSSQAERLQGLNKEKAMSILVAKLYQIKEAELKKELKSMKGASTSVSWGNQIRSYVLHPYQQVKDLRTGVETSDVEGVLDGRLDQFIEAEIKMTNL